VRNTCTGLTGIVRGMRQAAMALGLEPRDRLWLVEVPLALPSILAGIKTSAVINVGPHKLACPMWASAQNRPVTPHIFSTENTAQNAEGLPRLFSRHRFRPRP